MKHAMLGLFAPTQSRFSSHPRSHTPMLHLCTIHVHEHIYIYTYKCPGKGTCSDTQRVLAYYFCAIHVHIHISSQAKAHAMTRNECLLDPFVPCMFKCIYTYTHKCPGKGTYNDTQRVLACYFCAIHVHKHTHIHINAQAKAHTMTRNECLLAILCHPCS